MYIPGKFYTVQEYVRLLKSLDPKAFHIRNVHDRDSSTLSPICMGRYCHTCEVYEICSTKRRSAGDILQHLGYELNGSGLKVLGVI